MTKRGGGGQERAEREFVYRTGYGGFPGASEWKRYGDLSKRLADRHIGAHQGDGSFHQSAGLGASDGQFATELANAFSHSGDADTELARRFHSGDLGRDSLSVVAHLHDDLFGLADNFDARAIASGVSIDVAERFLDDPEDGHLDIFGNTLEDVGNEREGNLELAALHETVNVPMKSCAETGFVEQGRMEKVRGLANFLEDGAHGIAEVRVAAAGVDVHFYGGDVLREIVVEFTCNSAALFVLNVQECGGELLKLHGSEFYDAA